MGSKFKDLWNDEKFISSSERQKIDFDVELICKMIEAREQQGITQAELAEKSGLKQAAIARLESMKSVPKIDTVNKVLRPLGYKLAIVQM